MARSPAPSEPRPAVADPTSSHARKASQRRRASGAAEARQRRRDKHRHAKRSMWREIQGRAPCGCCADSSSDDDEDTLLLQFADAFGGLILSFRFEHFDHCEATSAST